MKEFEKWLTQYKSQLYEIGLSHPVVSRANTKAAWRAALEWVRADLKAAREGFDLGLYDTLKKELGEAENERI